MSSTEQDDYTEDEVTMPDDKAFETVEMKQASVIEEPGGAKYEATSGCQLNITILANSVTFSA